MNAFFYPSKRGINFAKIRGFKVTDYTPSTKVGFLCFFGLRNPHCKKQVFDQQFSEKLISADFGKLVLHVVIDKAVMRQRDVASLLGA